jgi:hypothetical protein
MNRSLVTLGALLLVGVVAVAAQPQDKPGLKQDQPAMKTSAISNTPEWQKLKSLVGNWEGFMEDGGTKTPATAEVRITGDGSAIMHVMGRGTPYEMVTMIHPDGKRLLATHYCAAHNQPRMALVPAKAPNQVAFDFVDGTNIAPGDVHMKSIVFTFGDADHHEETWTNSDGSGSALFKFTRKK